MNVMELEKMTLEELASIKGGRWIEVNGELVWVAGLDIDPEEEYEK